MLHNPVNGILEATGMITRCGPASLKDYVGCLFALPAAMGARVRTVPDGCTSIVIEFPAGVPPRSMLAGPRLQPYCYEPPAMTDVIGVRLNPGTAFALIGTPINNLVDRRHHLADLMGLTGQQLDARMATAQSIEARFDVLESFLLERLSGIQIDPRVKLALRKITESSGQEKLSAIARQCGISLRQLERLMHRWVGISSKRLARIARFQALLATVADGPPPMWTPLAAE